MPVDPVRVYDFVTATGDDPHRWRRTAPPGYAAAILFGVAPSMLESDDVAPFTRTLLHNDQSFVWHAPIAVGDDLEVRGAVVSVRRRSGLHFVGFEVAASTVAGSVLESSSTFILSDQPAADPPADAGEPGPVERGANDRAVPLALPAPGEDLPALTRSASRLDLVRYAAASGDWNPIHWDHASARAAGLPGIVVHGLLVAAWAAQAACRFGAGEAPLASMDLRFRRPLRAGVPATVIGTVSGTGDGHAALALEVVAQADRLVTGRADVRIG